MSFKDLESTLDNVLPKLSNEPFEYAMLRCLREINGNLDTIAVCAREAVAILKTLYPPLEEIGLPRASKKP